MENITIPNTNLPIYETTDIKLAAWLCLNKCHVKLINRDNKRITFEFTDIPRSLVVEYGQKKATAEVITYANKMSDLIREAKRIMSQTK